MLQRAAAASVVFTLLAAAGDVTAGLPPEKTAPRVDAKVRALVAKAMAAKTPEEQQAPSSASGNGATPSERAKAVAAWREFLARTPAERLCGS